MRSTAAWLLAIGIAFPAGALAQESPSGPVTHLESIQELSSRLTPDQKQVFDQGMSAFKKQDYAYALPTFKKLLEQVPSDAVLAKLAGESAINTGDDAYALTVLKPVAAADPNDYQATALLVRGCAESGDKAVRDAGMAHMLDLYHRGVVPQGMRQYVVERLKAGENALLINTSLVPWGHFNVYALGQIMNAKGQIFLRLTIESDDFDQPHFAKQHPKEAAQGMRRFSLDGYQDTGLNPSGQRTQAHFTYKLFDGQPSYDIIRQEFIDVVNNKSKPVSSSTKVVK